MQTDKVNHRYSYNAYNCYFEFINALYLDIKCLIEAKKKVCKRQLILWDVKMKVGVKTSIHVKILNCAKLYFWVIYQNANGGHTEGQTDIVHGS